MIRGVCMSNYINKYGEESVITPFLLPCRSGLYTDLEGDYRSSRSQIYTSIDIEVPKAVDEYDDEITNYWPLSGSFTTNFAVSRKFLPIYDFIPESLKVFHNNIQLDDSLVIVTNGIIFIEWSVTDGPLYISYIPKHGSVYLQNPDNIFNTNRVIASKRYAPVDDQLIYDIRSTINHIENYLFSEGHSYPPTLWTGGISNSAKSTADSIISGRTPVSHRHILEIRNSITSIENYLSNINEEGYNTTNYSAIDVNSYFVIEYINKILEAIHRIETTLINWNT